VLRTDKTASPGQRSCVRGRGRGQQRGRGLVARGQRGKYGFDGQSRCSVARGSESDVFKSIKGDEVWQKTCTGPRKYAPQNVIRRQPGPTAYAVRQADTVIDTLQLFLTPRMTGIILQMSNKEGERVYREDWKEICAVELKAYFGILFLAGVYRSGGEATEELQHVSHFTRTFLSFDRSQYLHRPRFLLPPISMLTEFCC
jgi:hypothetical protein